MYPTIALLLVVISPAIATAADPGIGQRVFVKPGVNGKAAEKVIENKLIPLPATVGDVNGDWLWLERAWVLKNDVMNAQQALDYFTEQIRLAPSEAAYWMNRAVAWREKGELDNAIKDCTEAIRLNPQASRAYVNRGMAWLSKGEIDNGIEDCNEAIRLDPQNAQAYNTRGNLWYKARKKSDAFTDYTKALRLDPQFANAFFNRGVCLHSGGQYDGALEDYTEAIRLNPKFGLAYHYRGDIWKLKGNFDNGITDYTIAIKLNPKPALIFANRGAAWRKKGEKDKALNDYKAAITLDPQNADICSSIAWDEATCPDDRYRDGKLAVEYATKACDLSAWKESSHLDTLAASYAESGDFTNAVMWQEKAIELAPTKNKKAEFAERLELYRAGMPYRDIPQKLVNR